MDRTSAGRNYLLCRIAAFAELQIDRWAVRPRDESHNGIQHGEGIAVDGVVGPVTCGSYAVATVQKPATLSEGSRGNVVEKVQTTFNGLGGDFGFSGPPLAVDGIYGPKTATAVRAAQEHEGLTIDGIVGLQAWGIATGDAGNTLASHCGVTPPFE